MVSARFQEAYDLHRRGRLASAQSLYAQVIEVQPRHFDALHLAGVIAGQLGWLLAGDLERGWKEHEWRWATRTGAMEIRRFGQPLWLGEGSIAGKTLLVHAEQGLGDTIQFCRYVPGARGLVPPRGVVG